MGALSPSVAISAELAQAVQRLRFAPPVQFVYNPLDYAWAPHRLYLERYGRGRREVLLLGMNPGPWGMAQTGVPFGDVGMVRHWLGLEAPVQRPRREHPKRPVQGFACKRGEVSGARLWGFAQEVFGTPQRFFSRFFVANYCPLCFMAESGRNITPDHLPAGEQAALLAACDAALRQAVRYYRAAFVVGVGAFAAQRARVALAGLAVQVGQILHPSPASPLANRGWAPQARQQLAALGIVLP